MRNGKIVLFQSDAKLQFSRGLNAYEKGNMEQAISYLETACLQDKNNSQYKLKLLVVLVESGEWVHALEVLNELNALKVENDECDLLRTICYANIGETQLARNYADMYVDSVLSCRVLKNNCGSSALEEKKKIHILLQLVLKYIEQETAEDLNRAILFLKQVIKIDEKKYHIYNYVALAFLSIKEYEHAKNCLDQVLNNDPYNILALCYYAQIYQETGQQQALNDILNRIKNIVPIKEEERLKLGLMFAKLGKYQDALLLFSQITTPALRLKKSFRFWKNKCLYHLNYN